MTFRPKSGGVGSDTPAIPLPFELRGEFVPEAEDVGVCLVRKKEPIPAAPRCQPAMIQLATSKLVLLAMYIYIYVYILSYIIYIVYIYNYIYPMNIPLESNEYFIFIF